MNRSNSLKESLPMSHKVYYEQTVASTWKISFDEVESRDPLASEILCLMAFLDGARIQREIFEAGGPCLTDEWRLSKADIWTMEKSFGCLQSYSLIRRLDDNDLSMHILVQQ